MDNALWVAIIGGLLTAIPSVIATIVSNNKAQAVLIAKVEANNQMVKYQIDELKKQVEKHNKVVERTYELEENVRILTEKMKIYHHE